MSIDFITATPQTAETNLLIPEFLSYFETRVPFLLGIIPWLILWAQIVVIPFYNKGEKLYREFNSDRNLALSRIEANYLLPSLARLFEKAIKNQSDYRNKPNMIELLNRTDYLNDLEEVENANVRTQSLNSNYHSLKNTVSWLWKSGFIHLISSIIIVLNPFSILDQKLWGQIITMILILIFIGSFIIMVYGLFRFHKIMQKFQSDLEIE